jgi:arylsulfatase A-like enzyme
MHQDLYRELVENRRAPLFDWPSYGAVTESRELVEQCRGHYASLVSMCDASLGNVLDEMDRLEMWDDTLLIVWTDHGFLLGEHDLWAKIQMPWYQELAHTPFFVWDPRTKISGERRQSLVQPSIDLGPTLLDFFALEQGEHMLGKALAGVVANDEAVREAAIFGNHGGQVNVTDGRYVYMRGPAGECNEPLHNYTLMPTHMHEMFSLEELRRAEYVPGFSFMQGCNVLRTSAGMKWGKQHEYGTLLYDVQSDPGQQQPLADAAVEERMAGLLKGLMQECEAPVEQYERLGL